MINYAHIKIIRNKITFTLLKVLEKNKHFKLVSGINNIIKSIIWKFGKISEFTLSARAVYVLVLCVKYYDNCLK